MSPAPTTAAVATPSLLTTITADVIKATFREGHPKVPVETLTVRDDGDMTVLVVTDGPAFEVFRPAQAGALAFRLIATDADRPRARQPVEVIVIPPPPPAPPSLEREAAAALATLEKAVRHLDGHGERLGTLLEYPPVVETWPILDAVSHVRRLVESAVTVHAALGDLDAALARIEGPRLALRAAVEAAVRPVAARNPLQRATAPRPVSETEHLLDGVEDSVRDGRGAARMVRDAWPTVVGRLRLAREQDVPTVRAMFATHEQALRARIGHAVDQARAQGYTTIDYIALVRNEETGLVGLHHREQDIAGLVRDLERLTA